MLSALVFSTLLWLSLILALRFCLKLLLSYHRWMFEQHGRVSNVTKVWVVSHASTWYHSSLWWSLCRGCFGLWTKFNWILCSVSCNTSWYLMQHHAKDALKRQGPTVRNHCIVCYIWKCHKCSSFCLRLCWGCYQAGSLCCTVIKPRYLTCLFLPSKTHWAGWVDTHLIFTHTQYLCTVYTVYI